MNRVNIDGVRFIDLDEIAYMELVPIQFIDNKDEVKVIKEGFRVDGVNKLGVRIESLCVDKQSGKDLQCKNWIMSNWVNQKK